MNEQALNIKFVQEVQKHQCLYNHRLPEYGNKTITEQTWINLGKMFNMTASQAKDKWKNLRAVFVRNHKNYAIKKKPYYLTDLMQFTLPFIRVFTKKSYHFIDNTDNVTDEENNEETDVWEPQPSSSSPQAVIANDPLNFPIANLTSPSAADTSQNTHRARKTKPLNRDEEDFHEERAKKFKFEDDTEDHRRMFLLSLLPDVHSMSDKQMRTFKRKVLALVDDILLQPQTPPEITQVDSNQRVPKDVVVKREIPVENDDDDNPLLVKFHS